LSYEKMRSVTSRSLGEAAIKRGQVLIAGLTLCGMLPATISAATLCVNTGGTSGCYASIGAAVSAASPNDTILVAPGTYTEDVVVGKPLSLVGAGQNSIIDASGLANGVYVDGLDNPGLSNVVVAGFTVENADFEGILITNASTVTIANNHVLNNDKSLQPTNAACPGLPSFETAEGFDCGEGIHLLGADHSIVAGNLVEQNGGGILLSDDTAAVHDNLIRANEVRNNPFDCGITLASHPPASITGGTSPLGVFHNTISQNQSSKNGLGISGAGAGVGIFDSVPGAMAYSNVVIDNVLTGNGLPGVAMHSHTPGQTLTDNMIVGNVISANGPDTADAATPGPTGINVFGVSAASGTVISHNAISNESYDIVANTGTQVNAHLNNLAGRVVGVDNIGTGTINATENWWGCLAGPNSPGCSTAGGSGVIFTPWLLHPF
jgi:parallel beta-helix repeat protein